MSPSAPDSDKTQGDDGGALGRVRSFLGALVARGWFDAHVLQSLRAVSAAEGSLVCELTVTEDMCNAMGSLHGGCAATLVDSVGTLALLTTGDIAGLSTTINMTYLRPVPKGNKLVIECRVLRSRKYLSTTQVDLKLEDGQVAATGIHTKFMHGQPPWQEAEEAAREGSVWTRMRDMTVAKSKL